MSEGLRIGDVARLVGISTTTLRAWEQRYQVVTPTRSAQSGYRHYAEADVERLRHMRALVQSGIAPSRAATIARSTLRPPSDSLPGTAPSLLDDRSALVHAGVYYDGPQLQALLDAVFDAADPEEAIERWLLPNLVEVGTAWEHGRLSEVAEHFVAAAVMRKLGSLFDSLTATGRRVVVGLPPHGRHEISALAFSICLRRRGLDVLYAGADVPLTSWRHFAAEWAPQTVVLTATMAEDVPPAEETAAALTEQGVPKVFVGGQHAESVRGAIALPESLPLAADVVARATEKR
ncbi:MAG: MerR family transcriptional regulator [Gordonia sp. (in: high G+C Gram-positive bacteria)]|uniref:MerR family transcriptional regulator n=1 Tax=Gordonia sp. (in: high G+C Gram-positive bacteria) TaxID=84139 RepID=UPI003C770D83